MLITGLTSTSPLTSAPWVWASRSDNAPPIDSPPTKTRSHWARRVEERVLGGADPVGPGGQIEFLPAGPVTGQPRHAHPQAGVLEMLGPGQHTPGRSGEAVQHQHPGRSGAAGVRRGVRPDRRRLRCRGQFGGSGRERAAEQPVGRVGQPLQGGGDRGDDAAAGRDHDPNRTGRGALIRSHRMWANKAEVGVALLVLQVLPGRAVEPIALPAADHRAGEHSRDRAGRSWPATTSRPGTRS